MARNSFVLSIAYAEVFKEMSEEQAGALIKAIFDYESKMILPEFRDAELKMAFKFIKRDLDYNKKKYEEICKKRAESGQKGGQTSKSKHNNDVVVDVDNDKEKDVVKGKEDCKGKNPNGVNGKTDILFGEGSETQRQGTEDGTAKDTETSRTGDEKPKPVNLGFLGATVSEETKSRGSAEGGNTAVKPSESPPEVNSWGSDIIRSTRVETYKARVEYGRSVGLEESEAKRIANFAQSKKIALFEAHYEAFVGKSGKEVEEAFNLLNLIAKRSKNRSGLKRINSG